MCENGDMANFVILIQHKGVAMPVSFVRGSISTGESTMAIHEVTIGQRFDATTTRATLRIDFDAAPEKLQNAIIEAGLYSLAAQIKGAESTQIQTPAQFQAWAQGFTVEKMITFIERESKRGRTVEYSQAARMADAKELLELQARALRLNRFIPMPATPELDLTELVKNKHAQALSTLSLIDVASIWDKLTDKPNAMIRIASYIRELGNPAFAVTA